VPLKLININPT